MADSKEATGNESKGVDFDLVYGGEVAIDGMAFDRVPWDIGRPQPLLVEFEKSGSISGEVLDIGCGPGDTATYLASLGYQVTGLDIAANAVEQARDRAAERGVSLTFDTADATVLHGYDGRFDTVVSSQLYHCLDPVQRTAHVAALVRVLKPGGRLIQFSANFDDRIETSGLYSISEEELRATFAAPDWSIIGLRPGHMEGFKPPEPLLNRFAEHDFHPEFTEAGLMLMPILALEAQRI
ncbi:class I SAM-dependent methyltransferase [Nocardia abscessus]|uniref:class I SAM-dependent methyltransferase n=1 Tax=Nocardia abscessus TaxID=120957 RepID=UPI00245589A9|nr:class I SAM-dependent methyltransferase [Nocardia abscessus]